MSTTIKYKDNVLATLENESITLKTANTYAEADVELNAVGGNPDGKTYQDQYKYVVLEEGEDEKLEPGLRYVKQNGTYDADQGKSFGRVEVDVDQVRDLLGDKFIDMTDVDLNGLETIGPYAFYGRSALRSVSSKTVKTIGGYAFQNSELVIVNLPNVISAGERAFTNILASNLALPKISNLPAYLCSDCTNLSSVYLYSAKGASHSVFVGNSYLQSIALPSITSGLGAHFFEGCTSLISADVGINCYGIASADSFKNCGALATIVLRKANNLSTLTNIASFTGTPFAEGGAGGTIYIPKVLYDHLGDGSSLDYKSATNWSTLDSYGTITWAQIEGSEYEHYYADGRGVLQDITQNLTNCTIDNDLAHYHTEFVTQIVPDDGYTTISGVSVSMGGVNITSSVYDATSRTITIDSPDGEIVITATGGA